MVSEEISRNVLEGITSSFQESALVVNKDGKVLYANKAFAKNINKMVEEVIGKSFYGLFPYKVAQRRKSHIEQVIKTREASAFEDERSGRYFVAHMTPMTDANGEVDKVLIIAYDITEKKKYEKELINAKDQLMSILNSIDQKISISDLETHRILFANTYTKNFFGEDIEGKLCYEVYNKLNKPCEFCPNEIVSKLKGKPYSYEHYNKSTNRYNFIISRLIKWTDGREVKLSLINDITDRKLAELKLKESEERHRKILENLSEGFFRTTPDGKYLMTNPALAKLYGYSTPEELIADTEDIAVKRFVNKEDKIFIVEQVEKNGYIKNYETLRIRKDGSTFWGLLNSRVVRDENGKTLYHEGTLVDITDRKKLEEEVLEEKEKLATLIDHAPFGMALIDNDGKYLYVNPTFTKLFGYDLNDIPDRDTWFKKAYPDEEYRRYAHESWHSELERFKSGEAAPHILTVTCKDGSKKKVEIKPVILPNRQFIMTFIDITEKERLEANYRSIFENSTEGIAQTTLDGRFIIANQALLNILGYNSFEDLTEHVKDIKNQIYVDPRVRDEMVKTIKSGKSVKGCETQLYKKDGTKVWVNESMSGIYDNDGNIMYIQAIVGDITDRKKREQEIALLQEQYNHAQKMEALGTLTGGIAHDFNNFLTAVTGYSTILKMKLSGKPELQKYTDQIISVSEKMADLVKSLLAFSRKQAVKLEPVDLNIEVEQAKKILKRLLTENIEVELTTSNKNPVIMADKTQLNQVLFNLTTNARDAMPNGGKFSIKIDTAVINEDFIKTHGFGKQGDYAVLSVSDTGIGMDKDILDKIFDPFFTTKEPSKGTGLGLASVYGIVKQHHGYIAVESSPGNGATFNIYFPLVDMTAKRDIKNIIKIEKGTGTILIGEDNEDVRAFLKDVLEVHGYRVLEAGDGEALVKIFKEHDKIDLIITDVIMPNKGGIDAYNEIKAIKKDMKFIFMSGYDKDSYNNIPKQDKTVKFILKPVSTDTLIEAINEILKT